MFGLTEFEAFVLYSRSVATTPDVKEVAEYLDPPLLSRLACYETACAAFSRDTVKNQAGVG